MVLALGPLFIDNPIWLYGLLSLIPLIILYLIKPKPKTMEIPSLMFFMQTSGHRKLTSFLKNFIRDLLFLIQFLLLLFLASSLASPYTKYSSDITAANTVLVIDASASSQTLENGQTRFQMAIDRAQTLLGARNTIILAQDAPLIALQDEDSTDAAEFLRGLRPRDAGSNLGDAILLAGELLQGKEGRVIVLSDFIHTQGMSPAVAKGALSAKGITTDFISLTGDKRSNIGFSDMVPDDTSTIFHITNYDDEERTVTFTGPGIEKRIALPPHATEPVVVTTPPGTNKFELATNDHLKTDDVAYLSAPEKKTIKVMLITNNASIFLKNALISSDLIQLTTSVPPIVSQEPHDVYIIDNINPRDILPGTFEDLARKAEQGATVIINAQQASDAIDYRGLLPVTITGRGTLTPLFVQQITQFTRDIDFGKADSHFNAKPKESTTSIITGIENATILALQNKGTGKVIYYGILEKNADFKISPYYPIFWQELLKHVTDRKDVRSLNLKIGTPLVFDKEQEIKTPVGKIRTGHLIAEHQGIYELADRKLAVNLLNPRESAINPVEQTGETITGYELRPVTETKKFPLELVLLISALALTFLEILYVKRRGDV